MSNSNGSNRPGADPAVNAYRQRIYDFPDRIYCFEDVIADSVRLQDFIKSKDVYLELGSGSGNHLNALAARKPESLFVGVEQRYKRCVRTMEKADKANIENLIVLKVDAKNITTLFANTAVSGIYVNFPDPWEKRRTWKHRMLDQQHLLQCLKILKRNGFISFKTDHPELYRFVIEAAAKIPELKIGEKSENLYLSPFIENNIQTEFESLFVRQNLPIFYAKFLAN